MTELEREHAMRGGHERQDSSGILSWRGGSHQQSSQGRWRVLWNRDKARRGLKHEGRSFSQNLVGRAGSAVVRFVVVIHPSSHD